MELQSRIDLLRICIGMLGLPPVEALASLHSNLTSPVSKRVREAPLGVPWGKYFEAPPPPRPGVSAAAAFAREAMVENSRFPLVV